jgi:D-lactate dehydrogenase
VRQSLVGFLPVRGGLEIHAAGLYFEDLSNQIIRNDAVARLLTSPNVIVTGHQAFFAA